MKRDNRRKSSENEHNEGGFVCLVCGKTVVPAGAGSEHRNHCPYCLSSRHLDVEPGASPPFPLEKLEDMIQVV